MSVQPILTTPRLLLRNFRPDDGPAMQAYASDPAVVEHMIWGPNTPAETEAHLEEVLLRQAEEPRLHFSLAIELAAEHRLIGSIAIRRVSAEARTADIGYVLARAYWGRGIMTEAGRAILGFGFNSLNMHRIWATCDTRNAASARVLEKLGMRREGHFRRDAWEKGGWRDSFLYAVLEDEWAAQERISAT